MNRVLVLLATYNGEKFLQEQLDSLYSQKKVEVLILVRDDGSKDSTLNILEHNKKTHSLEWYSGIHLNVKYSFYDLMLHAVKYNVDYFAFCDQDDVWDSDKLYIATQALNRIKVEKPALYFCGQKLVDENLNLIQEHKLNGKRTDITRFILSDFAGCTGVFNRHLLREVVIFKPKFMLMHDTWILKVCLCLGGKIFVDPHVHMEYRQHKGNLVGLGRTIPAYIRQVKQYMNEYDVETQMNELLRGYGDRMIPQYRELVEIVCNYRSNRTYKRKLLDKNYINFYNTGLNITYNLKVILNKL